MSRLLLFACLIGLSACARVGTSSYPPGAKCSKGCHTQLELEAHGAERARESERTCQEALTQLKATREELDDLREREREAVQDRNKHWTLIQEQRKIIEAREAELEALARRIATPTKDELRARAELARVQEAEVRANAAACQASRLCGDHGLCGYEPGLGCAATREDHCRRARVCSVLGLCGLAAGQDARRGCSATRDAHCRASLVCRQEGECSAVDGKCAL